ncbi:SDR family NAD(P)-dependent oxidoreductase [Stenotrophomonas sp. 24(2023)]|uniref:SDR family oxidoreductase n=1 Tax=Stenotrophomonas sp. 24(2023) TaxID=3068324 RepID=UPI0027E12C8A|nr:SDR family NAD(P)-dependent oxidoreductase [Stenotrophomonas sp. 24(2023)]WMJ70624.1 SDR family NAD(P)-dependent oxidoreductase [Stenotrophomonas sp. 24(2023)]
MNLTGNTILITGGSRGIGRALAEALHDRGNQVIITGRDAAALEALCTQHPGMTGLPLDLRDHASLTQLANRVRIQFPSLNVLIANAGISRPENLASGQWNSHDAEAIIDTNILGVLRTVATFLPLLTQQRHATLMATSSALAFLPLASFPTYCASKAFLHSWLVSLRHQLRHLPVEVLELSPPYVQTALTGAAQASDPRAMPVEEYVQQVLQKLERGDHPRGELLLDRDQPRRWAERDGQYDALFALMNPA